MAERRSSRRAVSSSEAARRAAMAQLRASRNASADERLEALVDVKDESMVITSRAFGFQFRLFHLVFSMNICLLMHTARLSSKEELTVLLILLLMTKD